MAIASAAVDRDVAYARCRAFTKARARNFYYAFAPLPAARRRAIYAVYAFAGTVDDIADSPADSHADNLDDSRADERPRARALDAARARLEDAYAGGGSDWLTVALGDAVDRYAIPKPYFLDLIQGMEQDLEQSRYATFADLEAYCYRAASVIGLICIEIFGYDRSQRDVAVEAASDMGKALQLTNILRDVKEDGARGRIYLAQEDLERFGYTEADLLHHVHNDASRALMAEYAARARRHYASGERLIPLLDGARSRMCCHGIQGVYRAILEQIAARGFDVFRGPPPRSRAGRLLLLARLWTRGALPPALARWSPHDGR